MKAIRVEAKSGARIVFRQDSGSRWSLWVRNAVTGTDVRFEGGISVQEVMDAMKRFKAAGEYSIAYTLE